MAVATLIAQGVSAVLSFFLLMRKLKGYEEEEKYGCYDFGMMRSMVKIAVPSTLQQSIVHMGILLVQSVVNSFGSAALAGYSAGSRIESLSIGSHAGHGKCHVHLYGPEYWRWKAGPGEGGL